MATATTAHPAVRKTVFSSASDDWPTPQEFFDALDAEFGFALDVCADSMNRKADAYYGLDHPDQTRRDGLATDWAAELGGRSAWMNPPYGKEISAWMAKAAEAAQAGATIVCLVPARCDTRWFHDHVLAHGAEVRFVRGRLKFGTATNSAPFASLVVIYRPATAAASAPVAAGRPELDAQELLQGRQGDQVRPRPAGQQVLDRGTGKARLTARRLKAPALECRSQLERDVPGVPGSSRSLLGQPALGERPVHVVSRPTVDRAASDHRIDRTATAGRAPMTRPLRLELALDGARPNRHPDYKPLEQVFDAKPGCAFPLRVQRESAL